MRTWCAKKLILDWEEVVEPGTVSMRPRLSPPNLKKQLNSRTRLESAPFSRSAALLATGCMS